MSPISLFATLACTFVFVSSYNAESSRFSNRSISSFRKSIFCYINGTRLTHLQNLHQELRFTLDQIDVKLCTHIVLAAAELDTSNWQVRGLQHNLQSNKLTYNDVLRLKSQRKDLKVFLSISARSVDYSYVAKHQHASESFVDSIHEILSVTAFDGINIDWRYPSRAGGSNEDRDNLRNLIMKLNLSKYNAMLSTVLSPMFATGIDGYDLSSDMKNHVDYWFIMAMEFNGPSSAIIGANAPLAENGYFGVDKAIKDYITLFSGQDLNKLILVVPFYGYKYILPNGLHNNESPINKHQQPKSMHRSLFTYREICQKLTDPSWKRGWDSNSQTPYLTKDQGTSIIVYDDAESVEKKTDLALRRGLGGVMAYSIEMDDFVGDCNVKTSRNYKNQYNHGYQERSGRKYVLLQSMYDTVKRNPNSATIQLSTFTLVVTVTSVIILKY